MYLINVFPCKKDKDEYDFLFILLKCLFKIHLNISWNNSVSTNVSHIIYLVNYLNFIVVDAAFIEKDYLI